MSRKLSVTLSILQASKNVEAEGVDAESLEDLNRFLGRLDWELPTGATLYTPRIPNYKDLEIQTEGGTGGGGDPLISILLQVIQDPDVIATTIVVLLNLALHFTNQHKNTRIWIKTDKFETELINTPTQAVDVNELAKDILHSLNYNEDMNDAPKVPSKREEFEADLKQRDPNSIVRLK